MNTGDHTQDVQVAQKTVQDQGSLPLAYGIVIHVDTIQCNINLSLINNYNLFIIIGQLKMITGFDMEGWD